MNDRIIPVNQEALSRALIAVVGAETAKTITEAYQAIDQAMAFGYAQGTADAAAARTSMTEEFAAKLNATYEEGRRQSNEDAWEAGYAKGFEEGSRASYIDYDEGYIDGVRDVRAHPDHADERVAALCYADEFDTDEFELQDAYAVYEPLDEYEFDYLEPKQNAAVEGQWTPEASAALDAAYEEARTYDTLDEFVKAAPGWDDNRIHNYEPTDLVPKHLLG